jgi:phosphatidylglycerol---prolipoprotein diacylglyceryl transferase
MNILGMITVGIDPIAFTIGPISIGWYGIMVTLAVITIVTWAVLNVRKDKRITSDMIINAALVGIPSGIIGARLLHVIDFWDYYMQNPGRIIGGDGLTIWGAVLGAAFGIWIYNFFSKHSFAHMADILAPGIILSQAVGRVGCTILGDDVGNPTNLPWGFVYTSPNSPAYAMGLTPTHPVVTYEIFYNLIVFGILFLLRKKLKPDGSLFLVYLSFYSIWRFASDFLREGTGFLAKFIPAQNVTNGFLRFFLDLHEAQFIGLVLLIICIVLFIVMKTHWVKNGEEEETAVSVDNKPAAEDKPAA